MIDVRRHHIYKRSVHAKIKLHKTTNEPIPEEWHDWAAKWKDTKPLSTFITKQRIHFERLSKFEAIFVEYDDYCSNREWIFINKDTICTCNNGNNEYLCINTKHRIADRDTQVEEELMSPLI